MVKSDSIVFNLTHFKDLENNILIKFYNLKIYIQFKLLIVDKDSNYTKKDSTYSLEI